VPSLTCMSSSVLLASRYSPLVNSSSSSSHMDQQQQQQQQNGMVLLSVFVDPAHIMRLDGCVF